MSLRWLDNRVGYVRVGIVVSKKVGKAVVRNRVRRRLREALREVVLAAPLQGRRINLDMVVVVRPEAADADYWRLRGELRQALKKGQVLL